MTLPARLMICDFQMQQLENINFEFLKSSIVFLYDDEQELYGSDVAKSREKMKFRQLKLLIEKTKPEHAICEFPVFIQFINNFNNKNVQYNFNWNKVSDDDTSPSAKSFDDEMIISKYFDVFLFSDIQYTYMKSKDTSDDSRIFRSEKIYSKSLTKAISEKYIKDHYDENVVKMIDIMFEASSQSGILFFTSRIDDPRYKFNEIAKLSTDHSMILVVANHLNVDISKYVDSKYIKYIDYMKHFPQELNRFAYFYTLSKLRNIDAIQREENDMHISLIEQLILLNDDVLFLVPNFTSETINSYIYNN